VKLTLGCCLVPFYYVLKVLFDSLTFGLWSLCTSQYTYQADTVLLFRSVLQVLPDGLTLLTHL
jgi:hypothetical protein